MGEDQVIKEMRMGAHLYAIDSSRRTSQKTRVIGDTRFHAKKTSEAHGIIDKGKTEIYNPEKWFHSATVLPAGTEQGPSMSKVRDMSLTPGCVNRCRVIQLLRGSVSLS